MKKLGALKRSHEVDFDDLFESISDDDSDGVHKPEHDAWADLAEEWENKNGATEGDDSDDDVTESADSADGESDEDVADAAEPDDITDSEEAS